MVAETTDSGGSPVADLLAEGLAAGRFSCAVAAVGDGDGTTDRVVAGQSDPASGVPATADTVFDVASLTKSVATTTVVLRLVEAGTLSLSDRLGDHLEALAGTPRAAATVRQLLTHTAGFQPYHYDEGWRDPAEALSAIFDADVLAREPGEAHEYSCLSYVHLSACVRAATGRSLSELVDRHVLEPAGMDATHLGPLSSPPANTAVTYDHEHEDRRLKGEIHDPIARAMAGESGNAGLFATAGDLGRFARALLNGGTVDGTRILRSETVDRMGRDQVPAADEPHGLGWRLPHDDYPSAGWTRPSEGPPAMGHTGYTGTSLWVDRARDQFAVLLTNAVHEDVSLVEFRQRFHRTVADAY